MEMQIRECKCVRINMPPCQEITFVDFVKSQKNTIKRQIACVMIVAVLFLAACAVFEPFKPRISGASLDDIAACAAIGPEMAGKVYAYVHSPQWTGTIDELASVEGIGPGRLQALKASFR